ncbi:MAG: HNH endonuclease family protein [Ignavibacteria bacterium]|nr:HNH endonuclease family protein [Ignavibacteria bacterium]
MSEAQFISILTTIRTYLIRRRVLGLSKGENKNIVLQCPKIAELSNSSIKMIEVLSGMFYQIRMPNDNEIRQELQTMDFYNGTKKYSKFILGKIEEHNTKVSVDFRNEKITIEHIMPQTLSNSWKQELGDNFEHIHITYLHNLGNLILTEFNSEIGNKPFADKKNKLNNSSLNFRLDVINRNTWNENDINEHLNNMIAWFLDTFPLPEDYRTANNWNITKGDDNTDKNFSPLDDEAGEIAKGRTPSKLTIGNEQISVKTWQDVFIEFLKWIKATPDYDYETIFVNQYKLLSKEDAIIKWKEFESMLTNEIDKDDETQRKKVGLRMRYKTFDGKFWDKVTLLDDDLEFVHINISASGCIRRIANIMLHFGIEENFVEIALKEKKFQLLEEIEDIEDMDF